MLLSTQPHKCTAQHSFGAQCPRIVQLQFCSLNFTNVGAYDCTNTPSLYLYQSACQLPCTSLAGLAFAKLLRLLQCSEMKSDSPRVLPGVGKPTHGPLDQGSTAAEFAHGPCTHKPVPPRMRMQSPNAAHQKLKIQPNGRSGQKHSQPLYCTPTDMPARCKRTLEAECETHKEKNEITTGQQHSNTTAEIVVVNQGM